MHAYLPDYSAGKERSRMRMTKKFGSAVAAGLMLVAMVGASSASAANWDPANTTLTAHGTLTLDAGALSVTCTYNSGAFTTGNDVLFTTAAGSDTAGPPIFSACAANNGAPATAVATAGHAGAWSLTATSTTLVDVTNGNATINVASGACIITAMSVALPGNTWNNATATLTPNGALTIPISESGPSCTGATTANMTGDVKITGASIT
jgi:hypothetical protein